MTTEPRPATPTENGAIIVWGQQLRDLDGWQVRHASHHDFVDITPNDWSDYANTLVEIRPKLPEPWPFPAPRYHLLDIWAAFGGDLASFEQWMAEPRRTPADAWAQLMAAIKAATTGDFATLLRDTNPPAGTELLDMLGARLPVRWVVGYPMGGTS